MERLNWAVLGLIGIVTALGLGTSSGAGKTKTNEQPVSLSAATDAPACCRSHSETTPVVAATPATTKATADEPCSGNCQETGVCCDKSLPKSETAVAAKTETHACEGECCLSKKATSTATASTSTDCPLTKAADALTNLTKNFVCEGAQCLTKPDRVELALTAADPTEIELTAIPPEGLSNLLAAAAAVEANQPEAATAENGTTANTITITSGGLTKSGTGTLTLQLAADTKLGEAKAALAKIADSQPPVDNSRAAARAAKLAKIEAKLEAPWELEFDGANLEDFAKLVQQQYGVPVIIDRKALEEAAFDLATPITATKQPEIEAGDFLRGVLNDLALTWIIPPSSDRVLITTRTAEECIQTVKSYDVTDLLENENDGPEQLINAVQSLVSPPTWKSNGGQGDLHAMRIDGRVKLVTANSYWVQRELNDFFVDLRAGTTSAHKPANHEVNQSSIRVYRLPMIASYLTNDMKFDPTKVLPDREKLVDKQKAMLQTVLAENPTFDPAVFQTYEYDYRPILVTKQTHGVHRAIERLLHQLDPQQNNPPPQNGFVTSPGSFGGK